MFGSPTRTISSAITSNSILSPSENPLSSSVRSMWTKIQNFDTISRCAHTATRFSHYMVVFGGFDGVRVLSDLIIFDLDSFAWNRTQISGTMPKPRYGHSACLYEKNKLIIFGGHDGENTLNSTLVITLDDKQPLFVHCEEVQHERGQDLFRFYHSAQIKDKYMYLFGGKDQNRTSSNQLWRLNLENFTWTQCLSSGITDDFPDSRSRHGNIIYKNKMYVFGGECDHKSTHLNDLWILNLDDYKWSKMDCKGNIPSERKGMSFVEFKGQFYLFGGISDLGSLNDLYSYNPSMSIWNQIQTKNGGPCVRADHACVAENNGLIIIGGRHQNMNYYNDIYQISVGSSNERLEMIPASIKKKGVICDEKAAIFKSFLNSKALSDVVIKVETQKWDCHKLVLVSQCRYFENMFKSGMSESQNKTLTISEIQETTFAAFLEYIYGHEVELNENLARELFELADKWSLVTLFQDCEQFLIETLSVESFYETSVLAEKLWASKLTDALVEFGLENLEELEKSEDLHKIPQSILVKTVFKMRPQFK